MPAIFTILFTRLQNPALKTPKFLRGLVEFFAVFVCKQGSKAFVDSVDAVQNG